MTGRNLRALDIIKKFGRQSNIYVQSLKLLNQAWNKIDSETKTYTLSAWENIQTQLYGEIQTNLFFVSTYLAWLMRTIRSEIFGIPIIKNGQDDLFSWVWNVPDLANQLIEILRSSIETLPLEDVKRDFFKDLYEHLVSKDFRVMRGEYNTPDWLAELMLDITMKKHGGLIPPRIIDPTCGTGIFLFHAIKQLRQHFIFTKSARIVGIDINPLMVEIAKTNYLLALGKDQLIFGNDSQIPVFCLDTLKLSNQDLKMLGEFNIVIGNPPWGSLRDIKNPDYQKFIKILAIDAGLIEKKDTHLYTQIEVSTVFFTQCMRFLKRSGTLAFVLPRSVITPAMQNYNFIRARRLGFRLLEILDLKSVRPLFHMPTCVLIGEKKGEQTYPIKKTKYRATLPGISRTLTEARPYLTFEEGYYTPERFMMREKSHYYNLFKTGVCIFPRSFYFITLIQLHNGLIEVKTSDEILAKYVKEAWKTSLNDWIEPEFIYYTILGWQILPYVFVNLRLTVLPVEKEDNRFHLLSIQDMHKKGAFGVAKWFKKVEKIWCERRTRSSESLFPSIVDRFNYGNLLKHQSPTRRFIVLYTATGRDLASCIVDRQKLPPITVENDVIKPADFIADVKTWTYETNNHNEALYLCGILNSDIVNQMIKPLQPRGLGGERAIHRRPLMLSIPRFDESEEKHQKIAELSLLNVNAMSNIKINRSRKKSKKFLPHREKINRLVKDLLRASECAN